MSKVMNLKARKTGVRLHTSQLCGQTSRPPTYVAKNALFSLISLICAVSPLPSCGHVVHRADVEPGFNASLLAGPAYHTYAATSPDYLNPPPATLESSWETRDTQLNLGWAWRLNNGKILLAQAVFVRVDNNENQHDGATSFDLYYQTKSGQSSGGVGVMLGLDPKLYFIWGRELSRPGSVWRTGFDFSIGIGIYAAPVMPQLMYTVGYRNLRFSALAEYRYHFLRAEDDLYESDRRSEYLRSRLFVGLAVTIDSYK
jgi:hypothetical protein